jgi:hypothetical protein
MLFLNKLSPLYLYWLLCLCLSYLVQSYLGLWEKPVVALHLPVSDLVEKSAGKRACSHVHGWGAMSFYQDSSADPLPQLPQFFFPPHSIQSNLSNGKSCPALIQNPLVFLLVCLYKKASSLIIEWRMEKERHSYKFVHCRGETGSKSINKTQICWLFN